MKIWIALFIALTTPALALAYPLSCSSLGSFESFELVPPKAQADGRYLMKIIDMAQIEPQELILAGTVKSDSFDVKAKQPNFRTGIIDMGRMTGVRLENGAWGLSWYPPKPTMNGSKFLKFVCASN